MLFRKAVEMVVLDICEAVQAGNADALVFTLVQQPVRAT